MQMGVFVFVPAVPEGALQNRHATPLQVAQLHESHLLRPLWESAVGSGKAGPQV